MKLKKKITLSVLSVALIWTLAAAVIMVLPQSGGAGPVRLSELDQRRATAEAEMRRMMSSQFVFEEDFVYPIANNQYKTKFAGKVYTGIPYTNASASGHAFFRYTTQDEEGIYHVSGANGYLVGNDCADSVFWAWATVSNTINFRGTKWMTENYGLIKVGDYYYDMGDEHKNTKAICENNGKETMYEAYAQLQKADAVVQYNDGAGHVMMVVETNVVYTDEGEIDGNRSHILYLDQSGNSGVDKKASFKVLSYQGFLPFTIAEFVDESEDVEKAEVTDSLTEHNAQNLLTGTISSNYRISDVYIEITDGSGNVVQSARRYANEEQMYEFPMAQFETGDWLWNWVPLKDIYTDFIDLSTLSGEYTCTVSVLVGTGETFTVRDFQFSV